MYHHLGRHHEIVILVINIDYFRYLSGCAEVAINFSFELFSSHYNTSNNVLYLKANAELLSIYDLLNIIILLKIINIWHCIITKLNTIDGDTW